MDGHVGQHHAGRQEGGVGGVMIGLSERGTSRRGCEPVLGGTAARFMRSYYLRKLEDDDRGR
ncbi:MAG: hypothetical protein WCB79_10370 [Halobacteriota archaeon]